MEDSLDYFQYEASCASERRSQLGACALWLAVSFACRPPSTAKHLCFSQVDSKSEERRRQQRCCGEDGGRYTTRMTRCGKTLTRQVQLVFLYLCFQGAHFDSHSLNFSNPQINKRCQCGKRCLLQGNCHNAAMRTPRWFILGGCISLVGLQTPLSILMTYSSTTMVFIVVHPSICICMFIISSSCLFRERAVVSRQDSWPSAYP